MSTFVYLLVFIAAGSTYAQKVPVTVYYESLCPDSIKFYTTQLYPTWNSSLKSFIDLHLVPYGKSNYTRTGDNYTFTCHHGEKECIGNRVQACALELIPKNDMDLKVKYINCLMSMSKSSGDVYPTKTCSDDVKLGVDLLDKIESCSTSNEGNEYLAALGNMTMHFQNPLVSVPTVVINNQLDDKDKEAARTDFKGVLCSLIKGGKPAECGKSGASGASYPAVLLITLLLAFTIRL